MINEVFFDPQKPYIFISYSHANIDVMEKTVSELFSRYGINIWYDAELYAGKNWDDVALPKLRSPKCKAVLFFASINALTSENVEKELDKAKFYGKIIIPINFAEKAFDNLVTKDIVELYNDTFPEKVNIAERIISNHLDSKLKYINVNLDSDAYYNDIRRAIEINAPDIEICAAAAPASKPEAEPQPKAASAPATETPKILKSDDKTSKTKSASSTGDITYTIYGKEYTDNQANMMLNVFAKVLQKHSEAVDKILSDPEKPLIRCASAVNYEKPENKTASTPSRYNSGCYLPIGRGIFIGTALNYAEKLRNIAQLLTICGEDFSVLQSEQIELPSSVKTRSSDSGDETYTIYGAEHSGNQTQMMVDVLKFLMEKHFDKREQLAELLAIKLAPMSALSDNSYFRTGSEFSFNGITYSIGTSFSRQAKLKQIAKAIAVCGEDISQFRIDGLDETKPASPKASGKRNFLED
ncbi:MAG: toll/interleukin-1 receptor domain-containing protein [Oscillospiraceae bacterium]|nr:toll/interleukin-1 receptor domain-containing protein [Oscillospiraceae bacterium]